MYVLYKLQVNYKAKPTVGIQNTKESILSILEQNITKTEYSTKKESKGSIE